MPTRKWKMTGSYLLHNELYYNGLMTDLGWRVQCGESSRKKRERLLELSPTFLFDSPRLGEIPSFLEKCRLSLQKMSLVFEEMSHVFGKMSLVFWEKSHVLKILLLLSLVLSLGCSGGGVFVVVRFGDFPPFSPRVLWSGHRLRDHSACWGWGQRQRKNLAIYSLA